jgi:hypothetical protein
MIMFRQYDTIATGGCPGGGGGAPKSVMITIKGFPMKITLEDMMGADAPKPPL